MESKVKEPLQNDSVPPRSQDSVYYAKEKKQMDTELLVQSGAGNGVLHLLQATKMCFLCVCSYVFMHKHVYAPCRDSMLTSVVFSVIHLHIF